MSLRGSNRWLRRSKKLVRFLALDSATRRYLRQVRSAGAVDREHYRTTHERLHPFFLSDPARHYVTIGEGIGLSPNASFCPGAYRRLNPGVEFDQPPLQHWLEIGSADGLDALDPWPARMPELPADLTTSRPIAICAHVYHLELWNDVAQLLESIGPETTDLWVTITDQEGAEELRSRIETDIDRSRVVIVANGGRDILPFIHLVNGGCLDRYAAVCKVHTKTSTHRTDGHFWRTHMFDELGHVANTPYFERFIDSDEVVLAPPNTIVAGNDLWGMNREAVRQLHERIARKAPRDLPPFPAGSMFWAKPELLAEIRSLRLTPNDFDPELGQLDGTMAHAVERMIGCIAAGWGSGVSTIPSMQPGQPHLKVDQKQTSFGPNQRRR